MYNKKQYKKSNNKKILHKVRKQWVTISLALFLLIGGGAVVSHITVSANSLTNQKPAVKVKQNRPSQNQSSNINNKAATQLHTKLVNNLTKQALRLGSNRGRNYHILRSRYRRSNNHYSLKNSGYRHSRSFVFNRYAPNNRKAVVPKRLNLRYLTWAEGHFGKLNLKLFAHKRNGWITLSNHNARRYRNSLRAIYKYSNRHHNRRTSRTHINYVSNRIYNRYNRQLRKYRYSMHHGSRWARRSNKRAYYALKGRMKYIRRKKAESTITRKI